jgi:hypothetical protein
MTGCLGKAALPGESAIAETAAQSKQNWYRG